MRLKAWLAEHRRAYARRRIDPDWPQSSRYYFDEQGYQHGTIVGYVAGALAVAAYLGGCGAYIWLSIHGGRW